MTAWAVFGRLTGQDSVVEQLQAAAAAPERLAHAWLFTGPPGSGRSVAARSFAAALLCPHQGCGQCRSCHQVAAGTHADLLLIRPDGLSYGVRQTRELVLKAATSPVYGRWRVVVFEDADRATEQAANALLKAIEEPPPRTIWLLCAPSAADLPTTIRSRCRLITLRTPPTAAVAEILEREGVGHDEAFEAARASLGHIGRARRLATDAQTARRRADVLTAPLRVTGLAESSDPGMTVRRIEAIMRCRERLAASVAPLLAVEELTLALAKRRSVLT